MNYDHAIKNKDKEELQFDEHTFIEFFLTKNDKLWGMYFGEFYFPYITDEEGGPYYPEEFAMEAMNSIERFIKRKSKIRYKRNKLIGKFPLNLYNYETNEMEHVFIQVELRYVTEEE